MANGGKFEVRPVGAAPLFDANSGRAAARRRWDKERENTEKAIVQFVSEELGREVPLEEAISYVVNTPQFKKSLEGHTAAAKFVASKLDLLPMGGEGGAKVDARQVHVNTFILQDREQLGNYIESLRGAGLEELALLVEAQTGEVEEGPFEVQVPIGSNDKRSSDRR